MENTTQQQQQDNVYFNAYNFSVHDLMLRDKPRTEGYLKAIQQHASIFQDAIVLDVGAGTGILSLFAAKYGKAKKVFAVEANPDLCDCANLLVAENELENTITVINDVMENINQLPGLKEGEKVDIIISEWMGFYLLHEAMFDSVFYARDKFLKEGGYMFPNRAIIYVSPCTMQDIYDEKFGTYQDPFYGLKFNSFIPFAFNEFVSKPYIEIIQKSQLLAEPKIVKDIDLLKTKEAELHSLTYQCEFKASKEGNLHGFCFWFDVFFEGNNKQNTVILSTAPGMPDTHWKQTCILIPRSIPLKEGDETPKVFITMQCTPENKRMYEIGIELGDDEEINEEPNKEELTEMIIKAYIEQMEKDEMEVDEEVPKKKHKTDE